MKFLSQSGRIAALSLLAWSLLSPAVSAYQDSASCAADASWIDSPSMPGDVSTRADNCTFQQFMWQSFLYLVQPSNHVSGALNFETYMPSYGLFVGDGQRPAAWGTAPEPSYCQGDEAPQAGYVYSNLTLQAGSHFPLIDQNGNDVFYTISVNRPAYDFITGCDLYKAQCSLTLAPDLTAPAGVVFVDIPKLYPNLAFPDGAIELKASWKVLTDAEKAGNTFYMTQGSVKSPGHACMSNVTLGLIGLHIISKTPNHPEFIWGTFEHKNNAPDCDGLDAPPLSGAWTFYNPNCSGSGCETNEYHTNKPSQVCRMHPFGDPTRGVFPNGLDCSSTPPPAYICDPYVQANIIQPNTASIAAINASVTKLLKGLAASDPNRIWANYELVGNVWTQGGFLPPTLQAQAGSLSSANASMETYVQNGEAGVTNPNNCLSCHNLNGKTLINQPGQPAKPVQLPPAGLAHIFNLLDLSSTGCDNGTALPSSCPVSE